MTASYPRDLRGYGQHPPEADWPQGARIAVQFVINYEEGAENNILHGDQASETFLSEIIGAKTHGHLTDLRTLRHPRGLNITEIVQSNSGDCQNYRSRNHHRDQIR